MVVFICSSIIELPVTITKFNWGLAVTEVMPLKADK
jgi:hypothetical protein